MPGKPKKPLPQLLQPLEERRLRTTLRAIIRAYPDARYRSEEARLNEAMSVLLGRAPKRGAVQQDRDELLEMLAFDYSIAVDWERRNDVSVTDLARRLVVSHPVYGGKAEAESTIRDLERKFKKHSDELLDRHSFKGSEDVEAVFAPVRAILLAVEAAGVEVDWSVLPPGARQGIQSTE